MKGTITLCNKLKGQDTVLKKDIWYTTTIQAEFKSQLLQDASGTVTKLEQSWLVLLPFSSLYKPYSTWKGMTDKSETYTLSQGDVIFFTALTEPVTSQNISSLKLQNQGQVCELKSITEVEQKHGAKYQFKITGV